MSELYTYPIHLQYWKIALLAGFLIVAAGIFAAAGRKRRYERKGLMSVLRDEITELYTYPIHLQYWKTSLLTGFLIAAAGMYLGWMLLLAALIFITFFYVFDAAPQYETGDGESMSVRDAYKDSQRRSRIGVAVENCGEDVFFKRYGLYFGSAAAFFGTVFFLLFSPLLPHSLVGVFSETYYFEWFHYPNYYLLNDQIYRDSFSYENAVSLIVSRYGVGGLLAPVALIFIIIGTFFSGLMNGLFYSRHLNDAAIPRPHAFFMVILYIFLLMTILMALAILFAGWGAMLSIDPKDWHWALIIMYAAGFYMAIFLLAFGQYAAFTYFSMMTKVLRNLFKFFGVNRT